MKKIRFSSSLLLSCCSTVAFLLFFNTLLICQTSEEYVKMADSTFASGKKDEAQQLYQKAAAMNNGEAHYALAYKYIVTDEERIFHFSQAAKMGYEKSVEEVFDALVFRANNLVLANPEAAYEIYKLAKLRNPSLTIFNEEGEVETIKKIIEAGTFDGKAFIEKYKIKQDELDETYGIWELAEEASRGGRFGSPDPKLILQLIARGGSVPAELESAVGDAYEAWKEDTILKFNICDYVTSGIGLSYCSAIMEEEANKNYIKRIRGLSSKLKNNSGSILMNAFNGASKFIEEKAWNEELHGGSGYALWARESIMEQKSAYLDLVEKINTGIRTDTLVKEKNSDKKLNETYQLVISKLKVKPIDDFNARIDEEGLRAVQRLWIKYRDTSATLFAKMQPSVSLITWKEWLTEVRIRELQQVLKLSEEY